MEGHRIECFRFPAYIRAEGNAGHVRIFEVGKDCNLTIARMTQPIGLPVLVLDRAITEMPHLVHTIGRIG